MGDLFGAPAVAGLSLMDGIVSATEEEDMIRRIDAEELTPFQFQGWEGKRLTRSFGTKYDSSGAIAETDPIPVWLEPVRDLAATLAGVDAEELNQVLLIRYDPGAGIGWHWDRQVYEHVVGISLGAANIMRFRRRRPDGFDRVGAGLATRSAYHLSGEIRQGWEHSIAPMERARRSVTFRSLSERGARHLATPSTAG